MKTTSDLQAEGILMFVFHLVYSKCVFFYQPVTEFTYLFIYYYILNLAPQTQCLAAAWYSCIPQMSQTISCGWAFKFFIMFSLLWIMLKQIFFDIVFFVHISDYFFC